MTSRVEPASDDPPDGPPPGRRGPGADRPVQRASLMAGIGILLIIPLSVFGYIIVVQGLVTPGDAAGTAQDIIESQGKFRLGVASLLAVIILDVVVAWALFRVFSPVDEGVSRLAAWLRIVFAGVFMVAIAQLPGVLDLLSDDRHLAAFSPDQLHAQALLRVDAFKDIWDAGLILFGAHLLVLGYLAYRSGYVPKLLGILLAIAGLGYLFDSFGAVLVQDAPVISTFTFLGEFLLALWLLIRGSRVTLERHAAHG